MAADYDMDSIEITITKKHQPSILNAEKAISNLQHYYAAKSRNTQNPRLATRYSYAYQMGRILSEDRFSNTQAKDLINMKPVRFTGELYSSEHTRRFTVNNTEVRFDKGIEKPSGFAYLSTALILANGSDRNMMSLGKRWELSLNRNPK